MIAIGFDLGKNCGYAIVRVSRNGIHVVETGVIHGKHDMHWYESVCALLKRIKDEYGDEEIYVAYEEILFSKSRSAAVAYGTYRGMLTVACSVNGIQRGSIFSCLPQETKKLVTSNSFATKEEVCEAVCRIFNYDPKPNKKMTQADYNATDALAVAAACLCATVDYGRAWIMNRRKNNGKNEKAEVRSDVLPGQVD